MKKLYANKIIFDDSVFDEDSVDILLTTKDCKKLINDCVKVYNSIGDFANLIEFLSFCTKNKIDMSIYGYVTNEYYSDTDSDDLFVDWFEFNVYDNGAYQFIFNVLNTFNLLYDDYAISNIYID